MNRYKTPRLVSVLCFSIGHIHLTSGTQTSRTDFQEPMVNIPTMLSRSRVITLTIYRCQPSTRYKVGIQKLSSHSKPGVQIYPCLVLLVGGETAADRGDHFPCSHGFSYLNQ